MRAARMLLLAVGDVPVASTSHVHSQINKINKIKQPSHPASVHDWVALAAHVVMCLPVHFGLARTSNAAPARHFEVLHHMM
jgi:hypothetical protein